MQECYEQKEVFSWTTSITLCLCNHYLHNFSSSVDYIANQAATQLTLETSTSADDPMSALEKSKTLSGFVRKVNSLFIYVIYKK